MDVKRLTVGFLVWLWQSITTFVILLIAGLLGIALVEGLQGDTTASPSAAPAYIVQGSADVVTWHPKLLESR
ncbi:MAG TPA: hypothetical protein VFO07_18165 [Roseiflexaceae bacterium]|nr:hypothetical protein [Roseiflexaceae bacterium]